MLLNFKIVNVEVLSGKVDSLEKVHTVPQPDVQFKFIHVLENLRCLSLTLDTHEDFRPVSLEKLLVTFHGFNDLILVFALKKELLFYFCYVENKEGD